MVGVPVGFKGRMYSPPWTNRVSRLQFCVSASFMLFLVDKMIWVGSGRTQFIQVLQIFQQCIDRRQLCLLFREPLRVKCSIAIGQDDAWQERAGSALPERITRAHIALGI